MNTQLLGFHDLLNRQFLPQLGRTQSKRCMQRQLSQQSISNSTALILDMLPAGTPNQAQFTSNAAALMLVGNLTSFGKNVLHYHRDHVTLGKLTSEKKQPFYITDHRRQMMCVPLQPRKHRHCLSNTFPFRSRQIPRQAEEEELRGHRPDKEDRSRANMSLRNIGIFAHLSPR